MRQAADAEASCFHRIVCTISYEIARSEMTSLQDTEESADAVHGNEMDRLGRMLAEAVSEGAEAFSMLFSIMLLALNQRHGLDPYTQYSIFKKEDSIRQYFIHPQTSLSSYLKSR